MWRVLIEHVPIEHVPYKVFTFNTKFYFPIQSFYFLIVTLLTSAVKSVSGF